MSGEGRTWALWEATEAAEKLLEVLDGAIVRAQVAGSIRRLRNRVHDIDVVVIPKFQGRAANLLGDMVDVSLLDERLMALMSQEALTLTANGPKMKRGTWLAAGIPFDLYVATRESWATTLLIRTGSALHNMWLCTVAIERGMMLAANGDGLFQAVKCGACEGRGCGRCGGRGSVHGQLLAGEDEASIFRALGINWVPAPQREREEERPREGGRWERRRALMQPAAEDLEIY